MDYILSNIKLYLYTLKLKYSFTIIKISFKQIVQNNFTTMIFYT